MQSTWLEFISKKLKLIENKIAGPRSGRLRKDLPAKLEAIQKKLKAIETRLEPNKEEFSKSSGLSGSISSIETSFKSGDRIQDDHLVFHHLRDMRLKAQDLSEVEFEKDLFEFETELSEMIELEADALFWIRSIVGSILFLFIWILVGAIPTLLLLLRRNGIFILTEKETPIAGQIGDTFGMANALFSGLGLMFVAASMFLQRKELSLQRKELRQTREEMHRSSIAQIEQAKKMEDASKIAALSQLHAHYENIARDTSRHAIERKIAEGKRNWTIRSIHMIIEADTSFQNNRKQGIHTELSKLSDILRNADQFPNGFTNCMLKENPEVTDVAKLVASLASDTEIAGNVREGLFSLYDHLWDFASTFDVTTDKNFKQPTEFSPEQENWITQYKQIAMQIVDATTAPYG